MAVNQDDYDVKYQRFLEKIGATPTKIIKSIVKVSTYTEVKQNEEEQIHNQRLASAQHQLKTVVIHNVEPRKLDIKFNELENSLQRAQISVDLREKINQEGNHFQIEKAPKILEGQSQELILEQNYQRIIENTQNEIVQPINYKQEHPKLETVHENDFNESNESHSPIQAYFNQFQNQSEIMNENEIQMKFSPLARVTEHDQDIITNQQPQLVQQQNEENQINEQLKLEAQVENNIIEPILDNVSLNQLEIIQEDYQEQQEFLEQEYKKVEEELDLQQQQQQQQYEQVQIQIQQQLQQVLVPVPVQEQEQVQEQKQVLQYENVQQQELEQDQVKVKVQVQEQEQVQGQILLQEQAQEQEFDQEQEQEQEFEQEQEQEFEQEDEQLQQQQQQQQEQEQGLQEQLLVKDEKHNQYPEQVNVKHSPIMEIELEEEPEQNDFDKQNIQSQATVINQQEGISKDCMELSEFKESSIGSSSKILEIQVKKLVLPKITKNIVKPIKRAVEKQIRNPLNTLFEQFVGEIQNKIIPVNWKKQPLLLRKLQRKRNILRLAQF